MRAIKWLAVLLLAAVAVWGQVGGGHPGVGGLGTGIVNVVAKFDATAQGANIGSTVLYAVPAGQGGFYRVFANAIVTQAATTSSTLPNVSFLYTDPDTSSTQNFWVSSSNTTNTLGTTNYQGSTTQVAAPAAFYVKAGTNITISTVNYASSGATAMQYAVHVRLEYLGS